MAILKLKQYAGVVRVADATLEAHGTEQAFRDAQYEFDIKLHDLRAEFIVREGALRREFLDRVAEIAAQ